MDLCCVYKQLFLVSLFGLGSSFVCLFGFFSPGQNETQYVYEHGIPCVLAEENEPAF